MSSPIFELFGKISLDSSELEHGLKTAMTTGLAVFGAIETAVVAFAKSSVEAGKSFDKSMSQVAATMGASMSELHDPTSQVYQDFQMLRDFAQEMGRTTMFTATQSADALNYMALAGYSAEQSVEMLPTVLNLAASGAMDLARASDMVTDTQTAFGMSFERTTLMVDEMAKTASTTNTSVEQLGDAFLTVGALAQELNGGFVTLADGTQAPVDGIQELEIALGAMANAGIKGSEAGTHMRNMIMKLSAPTEQGTKAMAALGVSVYDAEGKMRSLTDIFGDLSGSLGQLTQQEKLNFISDMFNARDLASAEALLGAIEGTIVKMGDETYSLGTAYEMFGDAIYDSSQGFEIIQSDWDSIGESILDATGAAQEMANVQMDNLAGDITYFQSALEGAQIALSDALTPSLREFVQFGTEGISQLTEAFKEGGIDGFIEKFGEIFQEATQKIVEGLPTFIETGGKIMVALVEGIIANIPTLLESGMQVLSMLKDYVAQNAPLLIQGGIDMLHNLADGLRNSIPDLLAEGLPMLLAFCEELRANIGNIVDAGIEVVLGLVDGLIAGLPDLIAYIPEIIIQICDTISENMSKIFTAGFTILGKLISGIVSNIPNLLSNIGNIIHAIFSAFTAFNWLNLGKQVLQLITNGIKALAAAPVQIIKNIGKNVIDTFKNGFSWSGLGKNVIDGIVSGIKGAGDAIKNTLMGFAESAWNSVKSFFGIASPSKLMRDTIGKYIPEGIAVGIEANEDSVFDAMKDLADLSVDAFDADFNAPKIRGVNGSQGGFNQTVNIYSPTQLNPSEIARQTRNSTRSMVLSLRGV